MPNAIRKATRLSPDRSQQLDALFWDFDVAWKPAALADFAGKLPAEDTEFRQITLAELVKIDLERRWKADDPRRIEEYLRQFPELGSPTSVAPELVEAEYQARRLAQAPADLAEFEQRFPHLARQLPDGGTRCQDRRGGVLDGS